MKLGQAGPILQEAAEETLSYMALPREHGTRVRTNAMPERILQEIRRRMGVVGNFPEGQSAMMLVAARLRHAAGEALTARDVPGHGATARTGPGGTSDKSRLMVATGPGSPSGERGDLTPYHQP